jgi:hypothetical protein
LSEFISVGGIKITDPIEIKALLTVPYARTTLQQAIIQNITNTIIKKVS